MGKLTNLLKWKKTISRKDEKGFLVRNENNEPVKGYMRIIGNKDLEDASLAARYASAIKRAELSDKESQAYVTGVAIFEEATKEQCIEMIVQGNSANWAGEAFSSVQMLDLPKLEEVAIDPDAPTLVELEKLDQLINETNASYRKELNEYVTAKEKILRAELESKALCS